MTHQATSDGSRLVYTANPTVAGVTELFSVPVGGGTVIRLSPPLAPGGDVLDFKLSADGTQVLFLARDEALDVDVVELYVVPAAGGPSLKLNGPMHASGEVRDFAFSPDGLRAIYIADQDTPAEVDLYSVLISGGAPVRLNNVVSFAEVLDFQSSPNSSRVVFRSDELGSTDLFSVPVAGGAVTQLNDPLSGSRRVEGYAVTPDSTQVIFSSELSSTAADLFSVPLAGGMTEKLNPEGVDDLGETLLISPDGSIVVFVTGSNAGARKLFSLALSDLQLHELSDGFPRSIDSVEITPDGASVLFTLRRNAGSTTIAGLHIASLESGNSVQLNPDFTSSSIGFEDVQISPDNTRVVYLANVDDFNEIFAVPASGGAVRKLNPDVSVGVGVSKISFDGDDVVYLADQDEAGVAEVYTVPWLGGASVKLNQPLVEMGVASHFIVDSGQVFFTAEGDHLMATELYQVAEDGGIVTKLSETPTAVQGRATGVALCFDDTVAIYTFATGAPGGAGSGGIARVDLTSEEPPVQLASFGFGETITQPRVDPTCQRLFFTRGLEGFRDNLYSVPVAGGEEPTQLNDPDQGFVGVYDLTADGQWVVYNARVIGVSANLYSVPVAGGVIQQLNDGGSVIQFRLSPDTTRVVYVNPEIFSAPVRDGMPTQLTAEDVFEFSYRISPDNSIVAYHIPGTSGLLTVPIEGGTSTEIAGTNSGTPSFTPDSQRILYRHTPGALFNLFSLPTLGGSIVQLNDRSLHEGTVDEFWVSPDSSRTVMRMTSVSRPYMLASVPTAGGEMVVLDQTGLSQPTSTGVRDSLITPDSSQVLYIVDRDDVVGRRLMRIPIDGGAGMQLNPSGKVQKMALSAGGSRVYYTVQQPGMSDRTELRSVPLEGGSAVLMHPPLLPNRNVGQFLMTEDGQGAIFTADLDADGVFDLYYSRLNGTFFDDGFETGDTSRWSQTVQ